MTVLGIDAKNDDGNSKAEIRAMYDYREHVVYRAFEDAGFVVEKCQGPTANRVPAQSRAIQAGVTYITGSGHGTGNSFHGEFGEHPDREAIFERGQHTHHEFRGKIVHFLSCDTAQHLGPDFAEQGCAAYFGYDIFLFLYPGMLAAFLECDSAIDLAFAKKMTSKQVYESVKILFHQWADDLARPGDSFSVYCGASLMQIFDALRCPSSPKGQNYGHEGAQLL